VYASTLHVNTELLVNMAIGYHLHIYCTNSKTCEVSMKHNLKMSVINVSAHNVTAHKDGYLDQGF